MTSSLLLVFLATYVVARPDVGLVYSNYKPPSTNYGVPEGPTIPSGSYIPSRPSTDLNAPFLRNGAQFQPQYNIGESSSFNIETEQYRRGYNQQIGQNINQYQGQYANQYQGALTTKNVYFFTAPEDPEEHHGARIQQQILPPKKNIKLIFIKAPTYEQQTRIVAQQPQVQEKTIVYVLVKKPEDLEDITIPTVAPLPPSKPEVYFIKYNTQKEAEEKISGTLQGGKNGDFPANPVNGEKELINSIKEAKYGVGKLDDRVQENYNQQQSGAFSGGGSVSSFINQDNPSTAFTSNSASGTTAQGVASSNNDFGGIFSTNNNDFVDNKDVITNTNRVHQDAVSNSGSVQDNHGFISSSGSFSSSISGTASQQANDIGYSTSQGSNGPLQQNQVVGGFSSSSGSVSSSSSSAASTGYVLQQPSGQNNAQNVPSASTQTPFSPTQGYQY